MIPTFPASDRILEYHLVTARTMLEANGIADPTAFDASLGKAS